MKHVLSAGIFLFAVAFLTSLFAFSPHPVFSQSDSAAIEGYAWSDAIGWIDLNCTNTSSCGDNDFGLSFSGDGMISGLAWSDSIGWISADAADLIDCPSAPCTASISNGIVSGWLRALSGGTEESGGWDGFISLSGAGYGVIQSGLQFSGYAWGDGNVGWLDFSGAYILPPTCTPAYTCLDSSTIHAVDASCAETETVCTPPSFCSPGSSVCSYAGITFIPFVGLTGHLTARPNLVPPKGNTKIYWDVGNVTSCTVIGTNGDEWSGITSGTAGKQTKTVGEQTIYTLTCVLSDNSSYTERATVNILPVFEDR